MQISRDSVVRSMALLALLAIAGLPTAFADDDPSGLFEPPQSRIRPPGGVASQARIGPVGGVAAQARIKPPGGDTETDARIRPPSGAPDEEPGVFDLLIEWLRARAGIQPPVG